MVVTEPYTNGIQRGNGASLTIVGSELILWQWGRRAELWGRVVVLVSQSMPDNRLMEQRTENPRVHGSISPFVPIDPAHRPATLCRRRVRDAYRKKRVQRSAYPTARCDTRIRTRTGLGPVPFAQEPCDFCFDRSRGVVGA